MFGEAKKIVYACLKYVQILVKVQICKYLQTNKMVLWVKTFDEQV